MSDKHITEVHFLERKNSMVYGIILCFALIISCLFIYDLSATSRSSEEVVINKKSYRQKRLRGGGTVVRGIVTDKREYVLSRGSSRLFTINQKITIHKSPLFKVAKYIKTDRYKVNIASIYNGFGIFVWGMLILSLLMLYYYHNPHINFILSLVAYSIILLSCIVGYFMNQKI